MKIYILGVGLVPLTAQVTLSKLVFGVIFGKVTWLVVE